MGVENAVDGLRRRCLEGRAESPDSVEGEIEGLGGGEAGGEGVEVGPFLHSSFYHHLSIHNAQKGGKMGRQCTRTRVPRLADSGA